MTSTPARAEPASPSQRALWLLGRYRGGNGMMGVPSLYRLRGPLDQQALGHAVDGLCRRHEALRTTFGLRDRALRQFVHAPGVLPTPVQVTDLRGTPAAGQEAAARLREFLHHDPDPAVSPLAVRAWRLGPAEHLLAVNVHHLVTDFWSSMLLARDLAALYSAAVTGQPAGSAIGAGPPALPPLDWQLADYVRWQDRRLGGTALAAHQEYWRGQLRGAVFPAAQPAGPPVPGGQPARQSPRPGAPMAAEWFGLPPDLVAALRTVARSGRYSLLSLLLTAVMSALRELTGQRDVAIGTVLANRDNPRGRQTAGLFADMSVIRAGGSQASAGALVPQVHQSVRAAREHGDLPFLMAPRPDGLGRPEDVVFHMLPVPPDAGFETVRFAGLTAEPLPAPDGLGSRFDLEVLIVPTPHGLDGLVRYVPGRCPLSFARSLATACVAAMEDLASAAHPSDTLTLRRNR